MPGSVSYRLNDAEVKRLLTGPDGAVVADLKRRCIRVETVAKRLCPVDNGLLRASITHEIRSTPKGFAGRVGTNVKYARFRHDGTGIYGPFGRPIVPRNASVLRWPTRGVTSSRRSAVPGRGRVITRSQKATGFAFARSVRGTPGVPFLRNALPAATAA